MPVPLRYSVARIAATSGNVVDCGVISNVDFSGRFDGSSPSRFTVVLWIRTSSTPDSIVTLLQCGTQFAITLDSAGIVNAGFAGQMLVKTMQPMVTDGNWHAIGFTYEPEPANNIGALCLFVDGILVDKQGTPNPTNNTAVGKVLLGVNAVGIDFASLALWNVTLTEDLMETRVFGVPAANDPANPGLIAAFDFANGPAKDLASGNLPVDAPNQFWIVPVIETKGGTCSTQTLQLSGSAITLMTWAKSALPHLSNGEIAFFGDSYSMTSEGTTLVCNIGGATKEVPASFDTDMTHAALTFDGTTANIYVNGVDQGSFAPPPQPVNLISFGGFDGDENFEQVFSIWDRSLSADEVRRFMTPDPSDSSTDPANADGCLCWYPFVQDVSDAISGTLLNIPDDSGMTEDVIPVSATDESLLAVIPSNSTSLVGNSSALEAFAKAHGIDPDAEPFLDETNEYSAIFDSGSEALRSLVSAEAMMSIARRARRQFRIASRLAAQGIRVTGTTHTVEGNFRVFHYHFADGPVEIARVPLAALAPEDAGIYTIATDVFGIILAALGVFPTAARIGNFLRNLLNGRLARLISRITAAIVRGKQAVGNNTTKAITTVKEVIKEFLDAKELFDILWNFITGSFWSILLTCLSIVAQIAAAVLSGMALIFAKLVSLAAAIAQLVVDLALPSASAAQA